jgi:hypothetical protein
VDNEFINVLWLVSQDSEALEDEHAVVPVPHRVSGAVQGACFITISSSSSSVKVKMKVVVLVPLIPLMHHLIPG